MILTRRLLAAMQKELETTKEGEKQSPATLAALEELHPWIGSPFQGEFISVENAREIVRRAIEKYDKEETP